MFFAAEALLRRAENWDFPIAGLESGLETLDVRHQERVGDVLEVELRHSRHDLAVVLHLANSLGGEGGGGFYMRARDQLS